MQEILEGVIICICGRAEMEEEMAMRACDSQDARCIMCVGYDG
jgi:hypothetical protein